MGVQSVIDDSIEKKLLDLNVAYIAKVLSTDGKTAKIQPLGMIKQIGEEGKAKAPIPDVPIIESARYKLVEKTITYVSDIEVSKSTENVVSQVSASNKNVVSSVDLNLSTNKTGFVLLDSSYITTTTDSEGDISSVSFTKKTGNYTYVSDGSISESTTSVVSSIQAPTTNVLSDVVVTPIKKTQTILEKRQIAKGDLVYCVCADRDITESIKGVNSVPTVGHHNLSDSIIVGIL